MKRAICKHKYVDIHYYWTFICVPKNNFWTLLILILLFFYYWKYEKIISVERFFYT